MSRIAVAAGRLNGLFHAIEVLLVGIALDLMDERRLASEIVMHDAFAKPELFTNFS
jgi:hypothetical protein